MAEKKPKKVGSQYTEESLDNIMALRDRFATGFAYFYRSLLKVYTSKSKTTQELGLGLMTVLKIVNGLDRLTGVKGAAASESDVDAIIQNVESLKISLKYFRGMYGRSPKLARHVDLYTEYTGLTMDQLINDADASIAGLKQIKAEEESFRKFLQKNAPEVYEAGAGFAKFFAQATLGPLYEIGRIAVGGITGIYKGHQERQERRRTAEFRRRFGPIGAGLGDEIFGGMYGERGRGGGGAGLGGIFGMGGFRPGGARAGRTQQASAEAESEGLTGFFDRDAYRARWTKEVLQLLKNMGGKGEDIDISSWIAKALPFVMGILPELLIGVAATAGLLGLFKLGADYVQHLKDVYKEKGAGGVAADVTGTAVSAGVSAVMPATGTIGGVGMTAGARMVGYKGPAPISPAQSLGLLVTAAINKVNDTMKTMGEHFKEAFPKTGTMPVTNTSQSPYGPSDKFMDQFLNMTDEDQMA